MWRCGRRFIRHANPQRIRIIRRLLIDPYSREEFIPVIFCMRRSTVFAFRPDSKVRAEAMAASFFICDWQVDSWCTATNPSQIRHAKPHHLEEPRMKTIPQEIRYAAMQH
jgi:hypothetical protein